MEIITNKNFELKPNSFVLANKPEGWTSFDAVGYLRKIFRQKYPEIKNPRVGHAGTLDPFATGLLIVAIGREATREIENFKNLPKTYETTIKLGEVSNTGDKTGNIQPYKLNFINQLICNLKTCLPTSRSKILNKNIQAPTKSDIEKTLTKFTGPQHQVPPMFSAKKIAGQRLYNLARRGKEIKRKKHKINISSLELLDYQYPFLKIRVSCSPGTYIRTLAEDIGKKLRVGAYCQELKRTAIGPYKLNDALELPLK